MKIGLGQSYDKVDVLPKKFRAYLDITKPASTLGVMGGYLIGSLFYFYYTNQPGVILEEWTTIIYVVITVAFAHGASQAMNMAEDAEMDRQTPHKQNRPIPSGIISEEEARTVAWFLMIFALGRSYMVNANFGIMVTILIIFGIFYNLDPIRAKERKLSIPWQAMSRGLLSFPAIWAAYGDPFAPEAWALGVFMFWYVFGFQNSADIIDYEVDKKYGIETFAVVFGPEKIPYIAAGSTFLMVSSLLFSISLGFLPERFIYLLGIIPFCIIMVYYMWSRPRSVSEYTGNHPAWLWFYIGMVLTVSIPLCIEVFL